ncbi:OLC1v1024859C1 [Oldenlandia corymbosa var. corymbosa]|uniref:OLC1v1024859C1 n=1 Tax=Oldenlandia corymbosa var. corymbosa TaxID=529605 RepID=A0AAV1C5I5_OLDCO|nr:OLC1v1024859C1 [Oldenlandia corymbosa var. corymbosa]
MPETFEEHCQSINKMSVADQFGFLSREIVDLFAQNEGALAFCSETLDYVGKESGVPKKNQLIDIRLKSYDLRRDSGTVDPVPLFAEPMGFQLSDLEKERLTALVRRGLFSVSAEVDSIVKAVIGICRLQSIRRNEESLSKHHEAPKDANTGHDALNWQKSLPSAEMDGDIRFILNSESSKVEQLVQKHSAQLLDRVEQMKQKLEEFTDLLLSKFRPMTLTEKQKVQKLIQNLPPKNLDRIVEIIVRDKPCTEEIHVDLEEQSNVTLWRLYFFVVAVESARKLCKVA